MPRVSKGPRLYLDRKRGQWVIRDGRSFVRTGCASRDHRGSQEALAHYITAKHRPRPSPEPLIADMLNAYLIDVVPTKASAKNIAYCVGSLDRWWGTRALSDITPQACREYAATKKPTAARVDLEKLSAAVKHWHTEYGPLAKIPRIVLPPKPAPRERWLTRSEAARLLWAARRTSHLARFILLGIYTGSRSGAIRELQWSWIDFDSGLMRRRALGKADNATKRRPHVRLGKRILTHLRRWRRLDGIHGRHVVHYDGAPIKDGFRTSWPNAVKRAGLAGVSPHTLRHTRATWMMQAGIDPWEAAGALGMSLRVLEATYGHHHTDYQKNAAEV